MAENYNIEIQVEPGGSNDVGLSVQANPTATLTMATEVGGEVHEKNAEAWAVGKRGGVDVASTDVTYHNNAKYFAEQAVMIAGLTVTCSTLPAGSSATAVVTDVDGHKNIAFGIPEGEDGTSGYMHIKWAAHQPTADSDMSDVPNDYIGVYTGSSATAPTTYTSYTWFKVKGEDGAVGPGVASGGTSGQFLMKTSSTDYATSWVTPDSTPGTNPDNVIKSSAVKAVKDTADFTKGLVAEEYDSVAHGGYAVGDYCYKTSSGTTKLMRCTGAVAQGGSWDPTKWTEVSLGEDVTDLRGDLDGLIDDTAGDGDTDKAWSADKLHDEFTSVNQAIEQLDYKGDTFDYDDIQTFTAGHEGIVNWLKAKVEAVQPGTGDPSPSNVRSIIGFSNANVFTAGKNLIPMVLDNIKQLNTSIGSWSNNVWTYAGITITVNTDSNGGVTDFTVNGANTAGAAFSFTLFASDQFSASRFNGYYLSGGLQGCRVRISDVDKGSTSTDDNPSVQISRQNTGKIAIQLRISSSANLSNVSVKPMISANANDTYEQYVGGLYTVSFPTSAGTVYGGELTVNADGTGKLTVDKGCSTISDFGEWTKDSNRARFSASLGAAKPSESTRRGYVLAESYKTIDDGRVLADVPDYAIYFGTASPCTFYIHDSRYSTASDFVEAMGDEKIVYYLLTPITYDLSAPQIRTLLGQNNLWCDTGDCSFQYSESVDQGDTTTAVTTGEKANWNNAMNRLTDILDMLAFREAGFTATETHQQDTVIVVGTELYRTTAAIPAGNAITPGTNCTKTTIIDEIVRLTT